MDAGTAGVVAAFVTLGGAVLVAFIQRNAKTTTSLINKLWDEIKGARSDMKTDIKEVRDEVGVLRGIVIDHITNHQPK